MRLFSLCLLCAFCLQAQNDFYATYTFSQADSLRGALRPERTAFDVTYYVLDLYVDMRKKSVRGYVDVSFTLLQAAKTIQLDLYQNMDIDRISLAGKTLKYRREANAIFIDLPPGMVTGSTQKIRVAYHGQPTVANNPPWDGGFVWAIDQKDRRWVAVACEGAGASLWWPNKDHLSDEPDSMLISIEVDDAYFVASNGNLRETKASDDGRRMRYDWFVSNPINNYNVSINIGHYAHFSDTYVSSDGSELALDYYVMDYNEERARKHFEQVKPMLAAYEHYLGKYPFWEDGYALIETPYLGMEHQSGIAYGNRYMRGYLGGMIPKGQKWDYIIIHETGHEYFGNSISVADHAEMWIHESFTTYLESLYIEYHHGETSARKYLMMQRPYITNKTPVLGPMDVNFADWEGSDEYYKGAWMLHTLRHVIDDDPAWFGLLRGFYEQHQMSIVNTADFVNYVNTYTQEDYTAFFAQYLKYAAIPVLQVKEIARGNEWELKYRWEAGEAGFNMPTEIKLGEEILRIQPLVDTWQSLGTGPLRASELKIRKDKFLIKAEIVD